MKLVPDALSLMISYPFVLTAWLFEGNRATIVLDVDAWATEHDLCKACVAPRGYILFYRDRLWRSAEVSLFNGMLLHLRAASAWKIPGVTQLLRLEPYCNPAWQQCTFHQAEELRDAVHVASSSTWQLSRDACVLQGLHSGYIDNIIRAMMPEGEVHTSSEHCVGSAYYVFVDGSAVASLSGWQAGAAFNVWKRDGILWRFLGYHAAPVVVDAEAQGDVACLAECTAMARGIMWCMTLQDTLPCFMCYDSKRAGLGTDGSWEVTSGPASVKGVAMGCRHLAQLTRHLRPVEFTHVRAHHGTIGNEIADTAAKAAAWGKLCMEVPSGAIALLASPNLAWAWMLVKRHQIAFPPIELVLARCVERPSEATQKQLEIGTTHAATEQMPRSCVSKCCPVKLASFNVQTALDARIVDKDDRLFGGSKVELMQEVFRSRGWHVIGLQETRLRSPGMCSMRHYLAVQCAARDGHHGVAIWFAKFPGRDSMPTDSIKPSHITVLHGDERVLLVRCRAPCLQADFCVFHAPQKGNGEETCRSWWQYFGSILSSFASDSMPLVLLGDANASVGECVSNCVGDHDADPEDWNGECFHHVLSRHKLWVPATFATCHKGASHTFVASRDESLHRNDFVALPFEWGWDVRPKSHTDFTVDMGQKRPDHFPAVVELQLHMRSRVDGRSAKRDWEAGNACLMKELMLSCPEVPWECSHDEHANLVIDRLQQVQDRVFPVQVARPRKTYITSGTWSLLRKRVEDRRNLKAFDGEIQKAWLGFIFHTWRSNQDSATRSRRLHRGLCVNRAAHVRDYMRSWKDLRKSLRSDKAHFLESLAGQCARDLECGRFHAAFQGVRMFRPQMRRGARRARPLPQVMLEDGSFAADEQAVADRWLEHFASVESAEVVPREALAEIVLSHREERHMAKHVCSQGGFIPTLAEWERSLRKTKLRKAPGPDGIRGELLRLDVPSIAEATYSLILKTSLRGQEPLRFKGGILAALYKGRGAHHDCANSRSILLSDSLAKRWHWCLRDALIPHISNEMHEAQAGAVPARGVDFVAFAVRGMMEWAKERGLSAALIFIDVRAAFYTVFRPLIVGHDFDDEYLAYVMQVLRLPPVFAEWLRDIVEDGHVASKIGVPEFLRRQVLDTLTHAWFVTRGSHEMGYTWAGTRPGDPLGDVLYTMLCSHVLSEVETRMRASGLLVCVKGPELNVATAPIPTWVDDSAVLQVSERAGELIPKVAATCSILHNVFGEHGLTLNTSRGKSEVMPMLRGVGSLDARRALDDMWNRGITYAALDGKHVIHFTSTYQHLGGRLDRSLSLMPEIKSRLGSARAEIAALKRHFFRSPDVSAEARAILFRALVLSKCLYNVGCWRELSRSEGKAWRHGVAALYRSLIPAQEQQQATTWSHHFLAAKVGTPHPTALLSAMRCQMLDHVVPSAGCFVHEMIEQTQGTHSWTSAVKRDLAWAAELGCVEPDVAKLSIGALVKLGRSGVSFAEVLKQAIETHAEHLGEIKRHDELDDLHEIINERVCPICAVGFCEVRQLAVHLSRVHGVMSKWRFYAGPSHACQSCQVQFADRSKLLNHLRYSVPACGVYLEQHYHPMELDHVKQLDDEDRAQYKSEAKSGVVCDARRHAWRMSDVVNDLEPCCGEPPRPIPILCTEDVVK